MKLLLLLILSIIGFSNCSLLYSVTSNSNYLTETQNIFTLDVNTNTVQSNNSLNLPYKIIGIANVDDTNSNLINIVCLDKPNKKSYLVQVNLNDGSFNEIGGVIIDNVFLQDDWINTTSNYIYANEKVYQVGVNINDVNERSFILVTWNFQNGLQTTTLLNSYATSWAGGDGSQTSSSLGYDYINDILLIVYQTTNQDESLLAFDISTTIPTPIVYLSIGGLEVDPIGNLIYSTGIIINSDTSSNSGIYQILPDYNYLDICELNVQQLFCNSTAVEPSMGDSSYNNGGYPPFFLSNDKQSVITLPILTSQSESLQVVVNNLQFTEIISTTTITNYWYSLTTNIDTYTFLTYQ